MWEVVLKKTRDTKILDYQNDVDIDIDTLESF